MTYFIVHANGTVTQAIKPHSEEVVIAHYEESAQRLRANGYGSPRLFRADSSGVEQYDGSGKTWSMVSIIEGL